MSNMYRSNVHLLDLPNEILLIILKKLDNIDVLYSLSDINNERLDILAQEKIFTNVLNFVPALSDDIYSIPASILDRFCFNILPRVCQNVKCLIFDSKYVERILLAADYPYLNELKLFNFSQDIASNYFTDKSSIQCNFRQQITDLSLVCNEDISKTSAPSYAKDVYISIFTFFTNLTHLSIVGLSSNPCQPLLLSDLPSTTFSSSTLTKLCISLNTLQDCLSLLDGRLKQLSMLIVIVYGPQNHSTFDRNLDNLPNLKCFSLTYILIEAYDAQVVPLLRRMSHLEELTLNLSIGNRATFVDGTHLYNEILIYMSQLRTFNFYIRTKIDIANSAHQLSMNDIQQTFDKLSYQQVACIVSYNNIRGICHVFSLPFLFDRLEYIGNTFPDITFNRVIFLTVYDSVAFKHEFFVRIARSFPLLKELEVFNCMPQVFFWDGTELQFQENQSDSIVEFPFLTSLNLKRAHTNYVEQFLNNTKTYLPRLTKLKVDYDDLITVTENFTRNGTRANCTKVRWLILKKIMVHSKDVYVYFPSL